jgi:sugar phosphate isomerase/epimerase
LGDLGRRADRYAVMIAFRSDMAGFASLAAALDRVACPWFGIDLDPPALLCDRWSADEIFSRLGPSIRHVRGRDANVGAERRVKPAAIGRGDTDWAQLLANLDGAGFAGWITLDPMELTDRAGAAAKGLEHLRAIVS